MRIGIDCRTMLNPAGGERAGVGHYTSALVNALLAYAPAAQDEFVLFVDHQMPAQVMQEYTKRANVQVVRLPFSRYKRYLPFAYSHYFVAKVLEKQRLDIFHSPAYGIPLGYSRPAVVTIHDLAIYRHPEWFRDESGFSQKVLVPQSVRKAAKVIAVSRATEKMITQLFRVPDSRIALIYEGFTREARIPVARRAEIREQFGIRDRFLFFIGTIEPRKNLERLVKAFDQFMNEHHRRFRDLQLVIAGGRGWKYDQVFRTISRARWSGNIRVIGYVTHEEKVALMQSCTAFVFPSLWEGFGLPVLEAASMGVPVLTSKISSLPEVGGPGALYVNPRNILSIQQGIATLMRSPVRCAQLGAAGRTHARKFSWKHCAKETYDCYLDVLEDAV